MAANIELNRGWTSCRFGFGDITLKSSNDATTGRLWPSANLKSLLNFRWVEGLPQFRNGSGSFLGRAVGVLGLGGVWDLVAINPYVLAAPERDARLMQLSTDDQELAAAGQLHIRVRTGEYWDESLLQVELLNPFTYERQELDKAQFAAFVAEIIASVTSAVAELPKGLISQKREHHFYADGLEAEVTSAALLMASYYADRRVPYPTLVKLVLNLGVAEARRCLSELPQDGSMGSVAAYRLVKLYT